MFCWFAEVVETLRDRRLQADIASLIRTMLFLRLPCTAFQDGGQRI